MKYKRLLKASPYIVSILVGFCFYFIGLKLNESLKGLFTNISSAFFAIPLIYLFFQLTYTFSQKRLNKELFDYAKMQIDRDVLSIINQLFKMVYTIEEFDFTTKRINEFMNKKMNELESDLSMRKYIGFQILKKWQVHEDNLRDILKDSYLLKVLENEQIISLISIIKCLRHLESVQRVKDLYIKQEGRIESHRIEKGVDINPENVKFPERYLLLNELEEDRFLVSDFGDFSVNNLENLLHFHSINEKYIKIYANAIFELLCEIGKWISSTGGEFVIDPKSFQIGYHVSIKKT